MVAIKIKATGEQRIVTPNIAHDLIDRGIAELVNTNSYPSQVMDYNNRQMGTSRHDRRVMRAMRMRQMTPQT